MIIDEAKLTLCAGSGGNGCCAHLRRSVSQEIGWGGSGGKGASIFLKVSAHPYDLSKYRYHNKFRADDGKQGFPNNKTGKSAQALVLEVPLGTIVRDTSGEMLHDLCTETSEAEIARGGSGGKGNYKSDKAYEGEKGEVKEVILDYRIPNDAALLGFPNSGKTSLFNALTNKSYKVGAYPFTTTACVWAKVEHKFKVFTLMDMPAVSHGSLEGKGLGATFLKHLYRTKLLLIAGDSSSELKEQADVILSCIKGVDEALLKDKKIFYLLTKTDTIKVPEEGDYIAVSAHAKINLELLNETILSALNL